MPSLNRLDLEDGISFTAIDPAGADTMGLALTRNGIDFKRGTTTTTATLTDGTEVRVQVQQLVIDPAAGTQTVFDIYNKIFIMPGVA